jgi:acyl-CoA hydrolase
MTDDRVTRELIRSVLDRSPCPRVVVSGNKAVPWTLLAAVDEALPTYRLFMLNAPRGIPDRPDVLHETAFVGAGMRRSPTLHYIPSRLSLVPDLFRTTRPPDLVLVHTSTPRAGKVSLGVEVNILPAAIEATRARGGLVLAQTSSAMPHTYGDAEIDVDVLDGVLEADEAIGSHAGDAGPPPDPSPDVQRIGDLVSARVSDGATLQMGIGLVPDAVLPGLLHRQRLGVWTEMVSDGILALDEVGALDPGRQVVASFAVGSRRLMEWLDGNRQVRMLRTETTNLPERIAENPGMTSINTALQVDLFGQANASRIRARIHSGFGGQPDFLVGALHAPGGQALLALRSWHPKADVSTIVPLVDEPVTSFQPTAVVTEQGVADVWGLDERAQARQLIDHAAHPRVRDELCEEAVALGLA